LSQIRNILVTAFITAGIFVTVLYTTGCKNKCGTTTCQNGGTCVNNVCTCPTGYFGNSCQTGWSDPAIGTYKCSRSDCSPAVTGANSWTSVVSKDATNGGFTLDITNFDNSNVTVVAKIDTLHYITVVPAGAGYGLDASGRYATDTIKLKFTTYAAGGGGYKCNMTMVKQ
jgi:hypothetical protein